MKTRAKKVKSESPFAENIMRLRNKTGLTQTDFAHKVGLTLRGLQDIEYGITKNPDFNTLVNIAKYCKVDLESIGSPGGPKPATYVVPPSTVDQLSATLVDRGPTMKDLGLIGDQLLSVGRETRAYVLSVLFDDARLIPKDLENLFEEFESDKSAPSKASKASGGG